MSKKLKILLVFFLVVIVLILVGNVLHMTTTKSQRPHDTQMTLTVLRKNLEFFHQNEGKYPATLATLQEYVEKHPEYNLVGTECKEYISSKNGRSQESPVLNDSGGWYFNCKTGEIRVNLTKPVSDYMPFYFGYARTQIPSTW